MKSTSPASRITRTSNETTHRPARRGERGRAIHLLRIRLQASSAVRAVLVLALCCGGGAGVLSRRLLAQTRPATFRQPQAKVEGATPQQVQASSAELKVHGPYELSAREIFGWNKTAPKVVPPAPLDNDNDPEGGGDDWPGETQCGTPNGPPCEIGPEGSGKVRTPLPTTAPWEVGNLGYKDPQIAVSKSYVAVTTEGTIAFYGKDGKALRDKNSLSPMAPVPARDFFKPLWDPKKSQNINTLLNLPAGSAYKCDPSNPYLDTTRFNRCVRRFYDTRVIFDEYRQRFWIGALASNAWKSEHKDAQGQSYVPESLALYRSKFVVAVSKTDDPRDGFYQYWWNADVDDGHCFNTTGDPCPNPNLAKEDQYVPGDGADYPCIGVSAKYFMHTNNVSNGLIGELKINNGIDKNRYTSVNVISADGLADGGCGAGCGWTYWNIRYPDNTIVRSNFIQPAVHHGPTPKNTSYLTTTRGGTSLIVWQVPATPAFKPPLQQNTVTVSTFGSLTSNAPQRSDVFAPGTAYPYIFTNVGTSALKSTFRNNQLLTTFQTCMKWTGAPACVSANRLVALNVPSFTKTKDRTFGLRNVFDDAASAFIYYGNPVVEMNKQGHIVLAYNRSGSSIYPEARYSAWLANEPDIRPSALLHKGEYPAGVPAVSGVDGGTQVDTGGISVDPYDDEAVWMAHAYAFKYGTLAGTMTLVVGKVFGGAYADIVPATLNASQQSGSPGQQWQVSLDVRNQGDGAAAPTHGALYLLPPGADESAANPFVNFDVKNLAPGQAEHFTFTLSEPPAAPGTVFNLVVVLDKTNQVKEYSETNNRAKLSLMPKVKPVPVEP